MYKKLLASPLIFALFGCVGYPLKQVSNVTDTELQCLGSVDLPKHIASQFEAISDEKLLNESLGNAMKGKLCKGKVYRSMKDAQVTLYRAWNSTNPNSKFGNWWAFQQPSGEVAKYRSEYEICYQWSPLDKLLRCTLKPETKVVVGTGQSAECSAYLTYPVSDKQQIYIDNPSSSFTNCSTFTGEFSWK